MSKNTIKKNKDGSLQCEVAVMIIFDDDGYVAFCPALQLTTYGDSEADVKDAFIERLGLFIEEMEEKNILHNELSKLGWILEAAVSPHFRQPENISIPTELLNKSHQVFATPFRISA